MVIIFQQCRCCHSASYVRWPGRVHAPRGAVCHSQDEPYVCVCVCLPSFLQVEYLFRGFNVCSSLEDFSSPRSPVDLCNLPLPLVPLTPLIEYISIHLHCLWLSSHLPVIRSDSCQYLCVCSCSARERERERHLPHRECVCPFLKCPFPCVCGRVAKGDSEQWSRLKGVCVQQLCMYLSMCVGAR